LKRLGAARVIAVDNNANMLAEAGTESGIDFILTDDMIPVADRTVDAALCANVFIEMGSIEQITAACREIARVLKPGAPLVVITTNPGALGANFLDYRYDPPSKDIKSGDRITCHIKGDKPFDIQDYYWTEEDYRRTFIDAGFTVEAAELPTAEGEGWLDETRVAPDIVFLLRKKN